VRGTRGCPYLTDRTATTVTSATAVSNTLCPHRAIRSTMAKLRQNSAYAWIGCTIIAGQIGGCHRPAAEREFLPINSITYTLDDMISRRPKKISREAMEPKSRINTVRSAGRGPLGLEQSPWPHARVRRLEFPRQPPEKSSSRTVLRRKDADTTAASNLINLVGDVDDIEACRQRS
jgi:hypothetical protein